MVEVVYKQLVHVKLTFMIKELVLVVQPKHVQDVLIPAKSVILLLQHVQNVILLLILLVELMSKQHVPVNLPISIKEQIKIVEIKLVVYVEPNV